MVDRFLVKNPLSYGVFFLVILLVFWATFTIGQYPMDWMQAGVTWLTETLTNVLPKIAGMSISWRREWWAVWAP